MLTATLVATIVAGCGGSNVGKSTPTGPAVTNPSGPLTNLAKLGYIDTVYLTGAGRAALRDFGDVAAYITSADWTDQQGNSVSAPVGSYVSIQADAYSGPQEMETPCTFGPSSSPNTPSTNADSRLFDTYTFNFNYLTTDAIQGLQIPPSSVWVITNGNMAQDETNPGDFPTSTVPGETAFQGFSPQQYPAYVRAFPGRYSEVTVRIDPNTIGLNFQPFTDSNGNNWGPSNPRGIFETTQFSTINFANQATPSFNSALSDFLAFNLSNMKAPTGYVHPPAGLSQWPSVSGGAGTVYGQEVYFSGDNYALSPAATSGAFYQLTQDISGTNSYFPGTFSTNTNISGIPLPSGELNYLPGTYALTQINPGNPSFTSVILSLEGMFVDWTKMFPAPTQVMAITLPSSQDNNIQDMVLFKLNSSMQIVDFYYGYIDFEAFEFYLYPINTLVTATPPTPGSITWMPLGYYHGTISPTSLYSSTGSVATGETTVRSGLFKLDAPITWQDGTNTTFQSGRFIVYRK